MGPFTSSITSSPHSLCPTKAFWPLNRVMKEVMVLVANEVDDDAVVVEEADAGGVGEEEAAEGGVVGSAGERRHLRHQSIAEDSNFGIGVTGALWASAQVLKSEEAFEVSMTNSGPERLFSQR